MAVCARLCLDLSSSLQPSSQGIQGTAQVTGASGSIPLATFKLNREAMPKRFLARIIIKRFLKDMGNQSRVEPRRWQWQSLKPVGKFIHIASINDSEVSN